jgi:phage tail-like protein
MAVLQKPSLSSITKDPLRNFVWQVLFTPMGGVPAAFKGGFMTVSGLGASIDVVPYRQGGDNVSVQNLPGTGEFTPLVLTTGVIVGRSENLNWFKQVMQVIQGNGSFYPGATDFRATVDIAVLAHPVTAKTRAVGASFRAYNAWPSAITYGDLDAGANQLLIEQMTLTHGGIDPQIAPSIGVDVPGYSSGA